MTPELTILLILAVLLIILGASLWTVAPAVVRRVTRSGNGTSQEEYTRGGRY